MSENATASTREGTPLTFEMKDYISQRLSRNWKSIGRRVFWNSGNFMETEATIEDIDHSYRFIQEKGYQMLILWEEKNSTSATAEALVQALRSEQLNLLASQLEGMLRKNKEI